MQDIEDVDFGGFRTILLFTRHRPEHPPPGAYDAAPPPSVPGLGCALPPKPCLMVRGNKPVSVATIRVGDGYMEVPFFATSDNHRGKGYGHCLLEAIEAVCSASRVLGGTCCACHALRWCREQDVWEQCSGAASHKLLHKLHGRCITYLTEVAMQVSRKLGLPFLLLCSTDDEKVRTFWRNCGFEYTAAEDVAHWQVHQGDLIYMTNTVQMHKHLPQKRPFQAISVVHGALVHRIYAPLDVPAGAAMQLLQDWEEIKAKRRQVPSKSAPAKGTPRGGSVTGALQERSDVRNSLTPPP